MKLTLILFLSLLSTLIFGQTASQNSLDLDGSNDYIQTNYGGIQGTGARTVEAWIKTPYVSGQEVITCWGTSATGQRFTFALINGKLRVEVQGSGVTSPTVVADTQWHHVAATYNATSSPNYRTYIDGKLDSSFNISTAINTGSAVNMRIGLRLDGVKPFSGNIDEVRVWNYARSQAQLDSFRSKEICSNYTGLEAYYRFNQGSASGNNSTVTSLIDAVSSTNNGTLNNFDLTGSSSNWVNGANIALAPNSDTTFSVEECGSYSSPGGTYTTISKTIKEIIPNHIGCDSNLTINVTIKSNSFIYKSVSACDSFVSESGLYTYKNTGIYNETFTNIWECDSTVQTLVTINKSSTKNINIDACYSYTSPSGKYNWSTSGVYKDTILTAALCDSILIINLNINQSTSANISKTACDSFFSIRSKTYSESGIYKDTIPSHNGCDSIVILDLTITQSSDSTIFVDVCDSFTTASGNYTWYNSGMYTEKLNNISNCDSIIRYTVNISFANTGTENIKSCGPYTDIKGNTYSKTGVYNIVLTNQKGCDSLHKIVLNIVDNNVTIKKDQQQLEASLANANYRWLDCDNGFAFINSETNRTYNPSASGSYAVEVDKNECKDTSECYKYTKITGVNSVEIIDFNVYPNPAIQEIEVRFNTGQAILGLINSEGRLIKQKNFIYYTKLNTSKIPSGVYFIKLTAKNKSAVKRINIIH